MFLFFPQKGKRRASHAAGGGRYCTRDTGLIVGQGGGALVWGAQRTWLFEYQHDFRLLGPQHRLDPKWNCGGKELGTEALVDCRILQYKGALSIQTPEQFLLRLVRSWTKGEILKLLDAIARE